MSCERFEPLLSAWIDGELPAGQVEALRDHLRTCPSCRSLEGELRAVARSTREGLTPPPPPADRWDSLASRVVSRATRWSGWWLLVPGVAVLAAYGAYQFATDDSTDALVKLGVAAVVVGVSLLLVSVLVERLRERRHERYGEVER